MSHLLLVGRSPFCKQLLGIECAVRPSVTIRLDTSQVGKRDSAKSMSCSRGSLDGLPRLQLMLFALSRLPTWLVSNRIVTLGRTAHSIPRSCLQNGERPTSRRWDIYVCSAVGVRSQAGL